MTRQIAPHKGRRSTRKEPTMTTQTDFNDPATLADIIVTQSGLSHMWLARITVGDQIRVVGPCADAGELLNEVGPVAAEMGATTSRFTQKDWEEL